MELTNGEKKLIKFLKGKGYVEAEEIFKHMDRNEASSSISWLKEKKIVNVSEHPIKYYVIGQEGSRVLEEGLPEENLLKHYLNGINDLRELEKLMGKELRYGLAQILKSGGEVKDGKLYIKDVNRINENINKIKEILLSAKNGSVTEENAEYVKSRKGMLDKVKKVHERGINGSKGWQYEWSSKEASRMLLRTHTTVNTIRYLVQHPDKECKIFSVEKIFRRENVDSKHLAEFTQVEGVMAGKGVTFGTLMKTLRIFYNRIGITDIRFKPSYFPYTEPSLEIHGKFLDTEMELGGAGMFRPEVLRPWGIDYNVAAWGLGLERLLMLVLKLDDIRDIYRNDLSFLKERKILNNIF